MKKIIILVFTVAFLLCGCQNANVAQTEKEPVKINLPKDNTVNGYRIEEPKTDGMPDKISGIYVSPNNNTTTVINNSSTNKSNSSNKTSSNIVSSENKTTQSNSISEENKNISYCGNKNSKKFHKTTCGSLKNTKDENKVYLGSKNDFINSGYTACKLCKP